MLFIRCRYFKRGHLMSEDKPEQQQGLRVSTHRGRRLLSGFILFLVLGGVYCWGFGRYRVSRLSEFRIQCERAIAEHDWTTLQKVAGEWTRWESAEPDAWLYLGEAYSQLSDHAAAVDALVRVPDASPKSHPALLIASDLQFGPLNQPLKAVETLKRLIRVTPHSITARQRLIYFYAVTLQRAEMIDAIRSAISAQSEPPESYVYLIIADHLSFSNGVAEVDKWMKSAPDAEVFQVARVLQLIDRIENAETPAPENLSKGAFAELQRLVQKYPKNLALYRYQLEAAAREQDLEKMERLIRLGPMGAENDSVICRHKAWYYLRAGHLGQAETAIKKSLELFPMDWHSWNELSSVLRRQGKLDDAESTAKIALEGKELRKELVQLSNARSLSTSQLQRIGRYAEIVGDEKVFGGVTTRVNVLGQSPPGEDGG
jgi:tetratricopeptide (TPR) repeat protein